jgi:hypothetical protein
MTLKGVCVHEGLEREDLDKRLNGFGGQGRMGQLHRPPAKALHLLKKLDLSSAPDSKLKQAGKIIFEEFSGAPGKSCTRGELKDDLTVSLQQSRLIDLNLPINVEVGVR